MTVAVEERRATACDVLTLMAETPATIRMDPYEPIFNPEDEELFTVEAMVCHPGRASMIEYAGVNQGKTIGSYSYINLETSVQCSYKTTDLLSFQVAVTSTLTRWLP